MSFAENLRQLRRDKGLSQEELAEIMDVSRQAVSRWEQGEGYPEVEKLLFLSSCFNVSLNKLMSQELPKSGDTAGSTITGSIVISSPNENVVVKCYKVATSNRMRGGKNSPKYALFAVSESPASFWGQPTTFLAWYADEEEVAKEVKGIQKAITSGKTSYELKYSAKVKRSALRRIITDE